MYDINTSSIDFEQLISHIPTDMVVLGPDLRYLYISPITIKDAELREWIIGKTDAEFCTYRQLDSSISTIRTRHLYQVLEYLSPVTFIEEFTKDNQTKYYQRMYVPLLSSDNNEVKHILGYSLDITEQRKVELASQQLVQQILDRESHKVNGSLARIKGLFELLKLEQSPEGLALYKHLIEEQIDEMSENVKEVTHILYAGLKGQK